MSIVRVQQAPHLVMGDPVANGDLLFIEVRADLLFFKLGSRSNDSKVVEFRKPLQRVMKTALDLGYRVEEYTDCSTQELALRIYGFRDEAEMREFMNICEKRERGIRRTVDGN